MVRSLRDVIELIRETPGLGEWKLHWGPGNGDELQNWARDQEIHYTRVDTTLYLLDLLWPNFVEIDGYILRESITLPWTRERLHAILDRYRTPQPPASVESLCNHVHIRDRYSHVPSNDDVNEDVWR